MVWTIIPDSDIDPDSPVTTGLMTSLRDNVAAAFAGDSGAPALQTAALEQTGGSEAVTQACIRASAVGQSELKTTSGEVSTTSAQLILPGGAFGFYPRIKESGDGIVATISQAYYQAGNSYVTTIYLSRDTTGTVYAQQTYIQASPPYDLGDGEIPLFIFAEIDNTTKEILSVYSAPEAPWHYNGKTNIKADYHRDGKGYQLRKDMSNIPFTLVEAKTDRIKMAEYSAAFNSAPIVEVEITQEIKNADMNDIPRPMEPKAGTTVVMLDPVSSIIQELFDLNQHDEFSVNELLHNGMLQVGTSPVVRSAPIGLNVHSLKWKAT